MPGAKRLGPWGGPAGKKGVTGLTAGKWVKLVKMKR